MTFYILRNVYDKLYAYQKEGIKWLAQKHVESLSFENGGGGILGKRAHLLLIFTFSPGDDMGLGKTVQLCSFLSLLFLTQSIQPLNKKLHCLIVMPVSVLENWRKEYEKWVSDMVPEDVNQQAPLYIFHNVSTKKKREQIMREFANTGGCMLTSYGMITSQIELFTATDLFDDDDEEKQLHFDYIILDEGTCCVPIVSC